MSAYLSNKTESVVCHQIVMIFLKLIPGSTGMGGEES